MAIKAKTKSVPIRKSPACRMSAGRLLRYSKRRAEQQLPCAASHSRTGRNLSESTGHRMPAFAMAEKNSVTRLPHSIGPVRSGDLSDSPEVRGFEAATLEAARLGTILMLGRTSVGSVRELTDLALAESLKLTSSEIGFLALVSDDGASVTIPSWCRPSGREKLIADRALVCSLASAGSWVDAARTGEIIVTNEPVTADPLKRGFPGAQGPIKRQMSVPVFHREIVVAAVGVANKATHYTADDVRQLCLLAKETWRLVQRLRDRIALEESEKRYRLLVDSMNEGLGVFDENCNITYANDRFCKMLGYSRGELEGKLSAVFLNDNDQAEFYDRIAHNKDEGYRPYEVVFKAKSGHNLPVIVSPQALFDATGNFVGSFAVVTDVSRLKRTEKRLRATNRRLDAERQTLREKNVALREVLSQIEDEREQLQRQVQVNVDRVLMPIIQSLKNQAGVNHDYVDFFEICLNDVTSPFVQELDRRFARLSPREMEICNMVKSGLSTGAIAEALHTSIHTVHNQRKKIRKKLKIAGEGANLRVFLQAL